MILQSLTFFIPTFIMVTSYLNRGSEVRVHSLLLPFLHVKYCWFSSKFYPHSEALQIPSPPHEFWPCLVCPDPSLSLKCGWAHAPYCTQAADCSVICRVCWSGFTKEFAKSSPAESTLMTVHPVQNPAGFTLTQCCHGHQGWLLPGSSLSFLSSVLPYGSAAHTFSKCLLPLHPV